MMLSTVREPRVPAKVAAGRLGQGRDVGEVDAGPKRGEEEEADDGEAESQQDGEAPP